MLRALFWGAWGLYVGEKNRQYFEHYGMPRSKLFPAYHCVDNDYFVGKAAELASKRGEVRAGFGITDGTPVILFAGKFIKEKQPKLLIEAFAQVRREIPCWLLIAGDGPLRQSMEDLIRRLNIPNILMPGFLNQTEIPRAYSAADLFVLPSYMETWGLVVNEAMNFSLPVVVTDKVGCAADLVRDGWNGFVVNHQRVDDLAKAMAGLVKDRDLRQSFGQRSYDQISNYSIKACADNIVAACLAVSRKSTLAQECRTS
jgi:glycosyltransferase involved in cell wall biosynthesis